MIWILAFFPLSSFAAENKESLPSINFLESILAANVIVQITFVILLVMSIVSWALILHKWSLFKRVEKQNESFSDIFLKTHSFEEIYTIAQAKEDHPFSQIFCNGYNEMKKILKIQKPSENNLSLYGVDNVERALRKSINNEISLLENGLTFLATVGSSCPFIGLFGTVFGIMDAFSKIAIMGSASLNVVAPGIAEALIATAFGLFAAIPATVFYNTFITKIKKIELEFNNFSSDFINIIKRNFF